MKFSKEQIEKAKSAKSAEELIVLMKAEGIVLSEREETAIFTSLYGYDSELSDAELDNVAGGGCNIAGGLDKDGSIGLDELLKALKKR